MYIIDLSKCIRTTDNSDTIQLESMNQYINFSPYTKCTYNYIIILKHQYILCEKNLKHNMLFQLNVKRYVLYRELLFPAFLFPEQ